MINNDQAASASILVQIASSVSDEQRRQQALEEALHNARCTNSIQADYICAIALGELIHHLPESQHETVLETVLNFSDETACSYALGKFAPYLSDFHNQTVLDTVLAFSSDSNRANALVEIVPHLSESQLQIALDRALEFSSKYDCARVLVALASYLPVDQRQRALQTALDFALAIEDKYTRARILPAFLQQMPQQVSKIVGFNQKALADLLYDLRDGMRAQVLEFCATTDLFAPPIFSTSTLAAITRHLLEICEDWH
jgi:hypothetical protein